MNQIVEPAVFAATEPYHAELGPEALDQLFRKARSQNGWHDRAVPDELLREAIDLAKLGPTEANISPMRIVFVKTPAAKERLKPFLNPGNVEKTMTAPVTAIVGYDLAFYDKLPKLFPHVDARSWYAGKDSAPAAALKSGTLQAAYFILALRSLGLDVGPIGGFDAAKVDAEFFAGTTVKTNFIINIGYGEASKLFPRLPRLDFEEMAAFA